MECNYKTTFIFIYFVFQSEVPMHFRVEKLLIFGSVVTDTFLQKLWICSNWFASAEAAGCVIMKT